MHKVNLEFLKIVDKAISGFDDLTKFEDNGQVISVSDGVAKVYGLAKSKLNQVVKFQSGVKGIIMSIDFDSIGVIILGDESAVSENDVVSFDSECFEISVGEEMLGRVVNALGEPIDGKGTINTDKKYHVERKAPGIIARKSVHEPMQTGLKVVDSLIPIGRGQRELIIGDRSTGKTAIAIDTIINHVKINKDLPKNEKLHCIYVAIGQKTSKVAKIHQTLESYGAMEFTTIVSASASDPVSMQYLAPYSGCAIGEYFRDNRMHALVIYDDLTKHAIAYRQMSLLLKRPPGREAYPGDVFYLHSRLLERAAKMSDDMGAGSLTALPIIETQAGDVSAYIPTNVISITDGQIFLDSVLFNKGIRPAINVGISVSRVGSAAQTKAVKSVSGRLKLDLAQFREIEAFSQFGSDVDASTLKILENGKRVVELLKQEENNTFTLAQETCSMFLASSGLISKIDVKDVKQFESFMLKTLEENHDDIMSEIGKIKALTKDLSEKLLSAIELIISEFNMLNK